jgi:hypothetical protein
MPRRKSLTSQLYRLARASNNVRAASPWTGHLRETRGAPEGVREEHGCHRQVVVDLWTEVGPSSGAPVSASGAPLLPRTASEHPNERPPLPCSRRPPSFASPRRWDRDFARSSFSRGSVGFVRASYSGLSGATSTFCIASSMCGARRTRSRDRAGSSHCTEDRRRQPHRLTACSRGRGSGQAPRRSRGERRQGNWHRSVIDRRDRPRLTLAKRSTERFISGRAA